MFTSIDIRKFRSCVDLKLDSINELLLLIGRNGAGKSNILKAIQWACAQAVGEVEKTPKIGRRFRQDGEARLTFKLDDSMYCYKVVRETHFPQTPGEPYTETFKEQIWKCNGDSMLLLVTRENEHLQITEFNEMLEVSASAPCLVALQAFLPEGHPSRIWATKVLNFLGSVRYYPLHNFDEDLENIVIFHRDFAKWRSEKNAISDNLRSLMYKILELKLERPDDFAELVHLIGPNGLGLVGNIHVDSQSFRTDASDAPSTFYFVNFELMVNDKLRPFTVNDLSFGTKRILFLLVAIVYDKSSVNLLEQPEDGVHTGLVDKLMPLFREYSCNSQFIIASHSTTLLNRTEPNEIAFVTNVDGFTSVRALSSNELAVAETFMRDEGALSDFIESISEA